MENIHSTPGALIAHLLEQNGWTQSNLASLLEIDNSGVTRLIRNAQALTPNLALKLESIFHIKAEEFLALQMKYELDVARSSMTSSSQTSSRAELLSGIAINELLKRNWIEVKDKKDFAQVEQALIRFFRVEAVDDVLSLPHSARKSNDMEMATLNQLAWIARVRQIAADMMVCGYEKTNKEKILSELGSLLFSEHELRKVPQILGNYGIRLVLVEALKGSKIDGVCFWLNDAAPVIGMSLRLDRIDNFWFVLRHELEHVFRDHGKKAPMFDSEIDLKSTISEEVDANDAAANFGISIPKLKHFIARKEPFFSEVDIIGFARNNQIHPGLVAGRLQYHTGKYNLFRKHLVPVRSIILPSATSDGWGNVYPIEEEL